MRLCALAILTFCFSLCVNAQTSPTDPNAPPAVPNASQDTARPQTQTPPDTAAPAPTPTATPAADTAAPAPTPTATPAADTNRPIANAQPRYLIAGTDVRAALDTPLSTKTSKVGDRFTATINYPVHDSAGNVVVPVGAKLNGQISDPDDDKVAGAIKDMGHLNLRFTDIQLPDGTSAPVNLTLISVHTGKPGPVSALGKNTQLGSQAIAAHAGVAALGRPIKGLAVGNLAGGGYVLSTTSKQVALPAECILRLRVERNTPLP